MLKCNPLTFDSNKSLKMLSEDGENKEIGYF